MKLNRSRIIGGVVIALALFGIAPASAEDDPFPGVAYQAEIPGTRITSSPGVTQSQWEASGTYQSWLTTHCPAGSGMGVGTDLNFTTDRSDDTWYAYCLKTWQPQSTIDAWATYRASVDAAQAAALVQSQEWNAANPGKQKCFQWGPFTDPNGGTSSGGVCANPVAAPSGGSDTGTVGSGGSGSVVETSTPSAPAPVNSPAPVNTNGFGGYAVVHPDGHVCGVIVSASSDPFGNGGVMPQEYMGCPAGSRIVFQSAPSESGNVAGWHGPDVILSGSTYSLPGGSTITGGIVTDLNGRTWNSGTGAVINPGRVDTRTVLSDTQTVLSDTATVGGVDSRTVLSAPLAIAPLSAGADTATAIDDLASLPEVDAEEEASTSIDARIVNGKTRIAVVSDFVDTKMSVVATKKGSRKKYTYRITTDSNGEFTFKSSVNLKGFTLVIYKDGEELDRDVV
jgi:hypothetical protein